MTDVPLCRVGELSNGEMRHVDYLGYGLLLAKVGGKIHCVDDACTHSWAVLSRGRLDRERAAVVCADCGGAFSLETGEPLRGPPTFPLQVYAVRVRGDEVVAEFV